MSSHMTRLRLKKMQNLEALQRWTLAKIPRELWNSEEAIEAMVNFCLANWAISIGTSKQYAFTIRARLLTGIKPLVMEPTEEGTVLPVAEEAKLSTLEIISGFRKTVAPPPPTDFPIQEET